MNHFTWSGRMRAVLFACVGVLLIGVDARAQQWQSLAGGANIETGEGGGTWVVAGGYITVGSSNSFNANLTYDVYVARWNAAGGLMWAFSYDFGLNADEFGYDIEECMNGDFVITGGINNNGGDLLLLRINNAGAVVWGKTFGGVNFEAGYDVIEALNGDIVAAGEAHPNMAANQDGLVVRTMANGANVFVSTYQPANGMNEALYGLDETVNGELVVCGTTTSFGMGNQGWLMRLMANGNVMWSIHDGGVGNEILYSCIELFVGGQAGNIVAVGSTSLPAPGDIYAIKYTGAGVAMIDLSIGTNAGLENGYQVREALNVPHRGDLLITGDINPGPIGGADGYAVDITPVWLGAPVLINWSMAYGGFGPDYLSSGDEDPTQPLQGFFLCGTTASPNLLVMNDPQQKYVIRTNLFGVSRCNEARVCDRTLFPNNPWANAPIVKQNWNWGNVRMLNRPNGNVWQPLCFTPWPQPPGPIAPPPNHNGDPETPADHSSSGSLSDAAPPQDANARKMVMNAVTDVASSADAAVQVVRNKR